MGFYPDVRPGDEVVPSAALENDIRHLLNNFSGAVQPFVGGHTFAKNIKISVFNGGTATIASGSPVVCTGGDVFENAVPIRGCTTGDADFWILDSDDLAENEVGAAVVSGVVRLIISGGSGSYAKLSADGSALEATTETTPIRILYQPSASSRATEECVVLYSRGEKNVITLSGSSITLNPIVPWAVYNCTDSLTFLQIGGGTAGLESVVNFTANTAGVTVTVDSGAKWVWGRGAFVAGKSYTISVANGIYAMAEIS